MTTNPFAPFGTDLEGLAKALGNKGGGNKMKFLDKKGAILLKLRESSDCNLNMQEMKSKWAEMLISHYTNDSLNAKLHEDFKVQLIDALDSDISMQCLKKMYDLEYCRKEFKTEYKNIKLAKDIGVDILDRMDGTTDCKDKSLFGP